MTSDCKNGRAIEPRSSTRAQYLGMVLGLIVGTLTACSNMVAPRDSAIAIRVGTKFAVSCPSGLTAAHCTAIQNAIDDLKGNSTYFCSVLGIEVENRMNAGGIVIDSNTTDFGWVYRNGSTTNLGTSAFNPGELAHTLSHEESHHSMGTEDLRNGAMNNAYFIGDSCAGPY